MICIFKPCQNSAEEVLIQKTGALFSYTDVGLTACTDTAPAGYSVNRHKRYIGKGETCFYRSVNAIETGAMYNQALTYLFLSENNKLLNPGLTALVIAKHFGIWSINPVRIVFKGLRFLNGDQIFSLAAGTVEGHMERGEERFSIRFTATGEVWFELFSFYKPSSDLFKPFYPFFKLVLKKFDHLASDAIQKYIQ